VNPIDRLFAELRREGRKAFIPFVPAGDPSLSATGDVLCEVVHSGADLVEIGFPYSDPIADGPVIQASYTRALRRGLKTSQIFSEASRWRQTVAIPWIAMASYSLVYRAGPEAFCDKARSAGFSGLVVPDLPVEEAGPLLRTAQALDLKLIQLVAPTTPRERAARIAELSSGFLYCVSVTGITGVRDELPSELLEQLSWLRRQTSLPICVGFGISKPAHVRMLRDHADGIIVGSAIVRILAEADQRPWNDVLGDVSALVRSLTAALNPDPLQARA